SARDWIDSRYDASVLHRATTAAIRRIATTGSAAKPKPAFDLPPLDLPPLALPRLSGSPRQISWAEDLRRRAVRDLTEERANETARDALRRYRDKESAFAEEFRSDLEAAIKAVGGDEAAELILGREIFLDARGYVESFDRARDWINHKTQDDRALIDRSAANLTSDEAAAILRRYAADAKANAPQSDGETEENLLGFIPETIGNFKETLATRKRLKQARKTAKKLKIKAEYKTVSPDVAEALNEELARVEEKYRDFWRLEKIEEIGYNEIEETKQKRSKNEIASVAVPVARYSPDRQAIRIRVDQGVYQMGQAAQTNYDSGQWSTPCKRHALRHEIGHAVSAYLFRKENAAAFAKIAPRLEELRQQAEKNVAFLGGYGTKEIEEFLAEAFAVVMVDEKYEYAQTNEFRIRLRVAKKVLATLDKLRFNG
ncbi:MAG: hypothetical protein IJ387_03840, partial [Thermoguttaceae bacterium]|nr:hypothetical protein [Thermoguttaceae bacterium]